jgi:phosphosulfolactate synthase
MSSLKISMACWLIADEEQTRRKIAAAHACGVPTVAGGGPFEVAVAQRELPAYLDLCRDVGLDRIECGEGFTAHGLDAEGMIAMARERGLAVQFELGDKHTGPMTDADVEELIERGRAWLQAGAISLIIEARESADGVGLFDEGGAFNGDLADRFADAFGHDVVVFEAPTKASQFTLLNHFGPDVQLANVRLEEVLRVEIYRRGLHSDAFDQPRLALPPREEGAG